jgi:RNA polymerase sigma-70 factor (ECF subfamily)
MEIESDEGDWALTLRGDGEGFGRVFDRHRDRVFRHSARLVPQATDADDVVAIVFLEAWRRRDVIRFVGGSMLPWLLVTATNTARNLSRSSRRHRALLRKLPPGVHHRDPAEDFDQDGTRTALRRLSPQDQDVLVLRILEGYSEAETASALGIKPGTVKSRLSRAKARLSSQLNVSVQPTEVTHEL